MPGPVIVSLEGTKISEKEKQLLAHPKVGGLVLFRQNYDKTSENSKESLKKLICEIREINPDIVIMVDHEGGKVWRFENGFTKLPSAKTFGDMYKKDSKAACQFAFEQGALMAKELRDCDIDLSLAPVLDLDGESNVIGKLERAFHQDPKVVAEIAQHFIQGMRSRGMPATAKHFPGHGSCMADSHIAHPVDMRSMEELQRDLYPFKVLSEKGLLGAVMPAHVTYPAVDKDHTAGFSPVWINGCLRMGCGFRGVVMSDCLNMEGANIGKPFERMIAAQNAGCDFLMMLHQKGPDLDNLIASLDQIPDTKESMERRQTLAASIPGRKKLAKEADADSSHELAARAAAIVKLTREADVADSDLLRETAEHAASVLKLGKVDGSVKRDAAPSQDSELEVAYSGKQAVATTPHKA